MVDADLGRPRRKKSTAGPASALVFVVSPSRVVDGIVEPKRDLDFSRFLHKLADRVEGGEAFPDVVKVMVGAMRLCVPGH